jgi:RHS repeat-associated protein
MFDGQGRLYRFGGSGESRLDGEQWLLDLVTDASGNTVTYEYARECQLAGICDQANEKRYLRRITYTGYAPLDEPGSNRVDFDYETRPDQRVSFARGVRESTNLRLQRISVYAGDQLVRRYELEYLTADQGPSLLEKVTLVGADDLSRLTLREYSYTQRTHGWNDTTRAASLPMAVTDADDKDTGARLMDVNGDGLADILGNGSDVWLGNGLGGFVRHPGWSNSLADAGIQFVGTDGIDTGVRLVDVNSDARLDLFIATPGRSEVRLNTGSGWTRSSQWSDNLESLSALEVGVLGSTAGLDCAAPHCSGYPEPHPAGCAPDHCTGSADEPDNCIPPHNSSSPEHCPNPIFNGNPTVEPFALVGTNGESKGVNLVDVNGDGRVDIVWSMRFDSSHWLFEDARVIRAVFLNGGRHDPGWHSNFSLAQGLADREAVREHSYEGYSFMDVNGDGLADMLRLIENKQAVYLANSHGWPQEPDAGFTDSLRNLQIFMLDGDFNSQGVIPMDFNDDGLLDFIRAGTSGRAAYVNTGAGWQPHPDMAQVLMDRGLAFVDADHNSTGTTFADIDGDGIGDIVSAPADGPHRITLSKSFRSGKLARATSLLGEVTEIKWDVSTRFDNRMAGTAREGLPIPLAVATSLARSDGRGNQLLTKFTYSGGLLDERGFLGFAQATLTPSVGLRREMTFYQEDDLFAQPRIVEAFDSTGALRTRDSYEVVLEPRPDGVLQIQTTQIDNERFDPGATTHSRVETLYDQRLQPVMILRDPEVTSVGDETRTVFDWLDHEPLGFWDLPVRNQVYGSTGELLTERVSIYDDLAPGQVLRGLPTEVRDRVGADDYVTVAMNYGHYGNLTRLRDRSGHESRFSYDTATATYRTRGIDPMGRTTRTAFDPRFGKIVRDVNPSGNAISTEYDAFGRVSRITLAGDETSLHGSTSLAYSDLGNPQEQFVTERRTEKEGTSDVFEMTTYFDAWAQAYRTVEESASGRSIVSLTEFRADGAPEAVSMPFFEGSYPLMMTIERDDLGRPLRLTDVLGETMTIAYSGRRTDVVDARGSSTSMTLDPLGEVAEIRSLVDGTEQTTRYDYDEMGRLVGVTDAAGSRTTIEYDGLGRRIELNDAAAGRYRYTYDGEGRLIEQIAPDGGRLELDYNAAGQLLSKRLPDGTTHVFTYGNSPALNNVGELIEVRDAAGTLQLDYDERGRVIERRRTVDGRTYVTGYIYDSMDRLQTLIYPDGFVARYFYDAGNNIARIEDVDGQPLAGNFRYNASHKIQSFTLGNGVTSSYEYDDLARMLVARVDSPKSGRIMDLNYAYDSANNVLAFDDYVSGDRQRFEYDELNRLVEASGPYGSESYVYDEIGNLLKKGNLYFALDADVSQRATCVAEVKDAHSSGGSGTARTRPGKTPGNGKVDACAMSFPGIDSSRLARAVALKYDLRGNVVQKGLQRFAYDGENRLVGIRGAGGRLVEHNRYDANGQRIVQANQDGKTVYIDGIYEETRTHASRHVRAGALLISTTVKPRADVRLIASSKPPVQGWINAGLENSVLALLVLGVLFPFCAGAARRLGRALRRLDRFIRSQPSNAAMLALIVVTNAMAGWPNASVAASVKAVGQEKSYYYHANHIGSVTVVTGEKGQVAASRQYKPYGDPYDWNGAKAGPRELLQTFQGHQFDDASGLYYFNARFYDPEIGRFLSADTQVTNRSDPTTLNRYAFAGGNPVQFVDPTGHGFLSAIGDFFSDAFNWIADHVKEILTVLIIIVVVIALIVSVVAAAPLWLVLGLAGAAFFAYKAFSQGYTYEDTEFWIAAGTGAVLGGLVGAALPYMFASPAGLWGFIGQGMLVGAAIGGLEAAIACATGCGTVDELLMPILHGIVIGAITGAILGGVAGKLKLMKLPWMSLKGFSLNLFARIAQPGAISFTYRSGWSAYHQITGQGRHLFREDVGRYIATRVAPVYDYFANLPEPSPNLFLNFIEERDLGLAPATP